MPHKFKKPCRFSNCPELTHDKYCEKHQKVVNHHYYKYQRDPEINKRYDGRWRKIRKEYIKAHPLCEICKQEGRLTPAKEIHHVISLDKGGSHDWDNLMSLCKSCHSTESAKSGDRWNKKGMIFKY